MNSNDSGIESISSQHSTQSFPGTFEMLSSGDMFDDFGWGAEFSPSYSQDLFDKFSQGSVTSFKSTSSLSSDNEIYGYSNDSTQLNQNSTIQFASAVIFRPNCSKTLWSSFLVLSAKRADL